VAEVSVFCDDNDGADELRTLAGWLSDEDEFRGRVRLARRVLQSGQMGGVLDALTVAVGSGGAAGTLVQSLFLWLKQRRSTPTVRLKLRSDDGREAELDLQGVQDATTIVDQVIAFFDQDKS
jgi:hypothetical protein